MNQITERDFTHTDSSQQHSLSLYRRAQLNSGPKGGTSKLPIAKCSYRISITVTMISSLPLPLSFLSTSQQGAPTAPDMHACLLTPILKFSSSLASYSGALPGVQQQEKDD